jgi:DNA-binding transcriptional LysR family regulator
MLNERSMMSLTLKQVEAFYWIATLGSFVDAARRLNLAQSTISKRILELEAVLGRSLLDRSSRIVRLTPAGESLMPVAADMLALETRCHEAVASPLAFRGPFRFGVTELIALTWLPNLVVALKEAYPHVVPQPQVGASGYLFNLLSDRELDLVIGLDPPQGAAFNAVPLQSVVLEWVCAPGFGPTEDRLPLGRLADYPILTQAEGSGLQRLVIDWLAANGVRVNQVVQCDSLNVLAGLAATGLGITFLTARYFAPEISSGRLRVIHTEPAIPPIQYFAVHRTRELNALGGIIARIAQTCCDFSIPRLSER